MAVLLHEAVGFAPRGKRPGEFRIEIERFVEVGDSGFVAAHQLTCAGSGHECGGAGGPFQVSLPDE